MRSLRFAVLAIVIVIVLAITLRISFFNKVSREPAPSTTPLTYSNNALELKFKDQNLMVSYFKIAEDDRISLHPNFEEKLTSSQILEKENCKYLANGGFYDKDNRPIGLFVTKGERLSNETNSSLFNGFVDILDGVFSITQEPQDANFSLQTGPILVKDGYRWNLRLRNDEFARRIVVVKPNKKEIYFFAIYNRDSQISGPKLVDLPEVIVQIGEKIGIDVVDAINLDGGSASAFYDGATLLRELSPIGSYFCVN